MKNGIDFIRYKNSQQNLQNNLKKRIYNQEQTKKAIWIQMSIMDKIFNTCTWNKIDNIFSSNLLYEISRFIYPNPIKFLIPIYKHVQDKKLYLQIKKNYILFNSSQISNKKIFLQGNKHYQSQKHTQLRDNQQNMVKKEICPVNKANQKLKNKSQYSISVKIIKVWKNCNINYQSTSWKQISLKSKHLIDFLKNVKIDNPKEPINQNQQIQRIQNSQKVCQAQTRTHTLICQNYDYMYNRICQIQQNQKSKQLNEMIARIYVQIMNKNMILLNIQSNNQNPVSIKSQGKYLYIQNKLKRQLKSQRFNRFYGKIKQYEIHQNIQKIIPYLDCNYGTFLGIQLLLFKFQKLTVQSKYLGGIPKNLSNWKCIFFDHQISIE